MRQVVLASTSPFRRALLEKILPKFETCAPKVDESRDPAEPAEELVRRLAVDKARAVAAEYPNALIIGSDQVALNGGEILGKPGNHERAVAQLQSASGKRVTFLTGLCLLNSANGGYQVEAVPFHVHFRTLSEGQIENYLQREQPYNCAGSFKSEALGIALFERLEGDDPNALIGLPLIRLIRMFEQEGFDILQP